MEIWQKTALKNVLSVVRKSDLTQAEFAKKANLNAKHFNAVLNEKKPITRHFVKAVAAVLDRPTEWFYENHSKPLTKQPLDSLSFADALLVLGAFEKAEPDIRAAVLYLLTRDRAHLELIDDLEPALEVLSQAK